MDQDKVRHVLRSVVEESALMRQLQQNPESLRERFDLNDREVEALTSARMIVQVQDTTLTFVTGTTITAG
jgi:hypothetical protein